MLAQTYRVLLSHSPAPRRTRYVRPSTPDQRRTVVITSSDGINNSPRPWLLGIELRERDRHWNPIPNPASTAPSERPSISDAPLIESHRHLHARLHPQRHVRSRDRPS